MRAPDVVDAPEDVEEVIAEDAVEDVVEDVVPEVIVLERLASSAVKLPAAASFFLICPGAFSEFPGALVLLFCPGALAELPGALEALRSRTAAALAAVEVVLAVADEAVELDAGESV